LTKAFSAAHWRAFLRSPLVAPRNRPIRPGSVHVGTAAPVRVAWLVVHAATVLALPVGAPIHAQSAAQRDSIPAAQQDSLQRVSSWGELDASSGGFLIGRNALGELSVGGYALVRFLDQHAQDSFSDHLGNEHPIDGRRDIQFHRAMLHFKGWVGSPKLRYQFTVWSLLSTDQDVIYGYVGYLADPRFHIWAGINTIGGSRSMFGSHPFWLGHDRVMADEFFRPQFTGTVWVNGEVLPGLWYLAAVGDNLSILGTNAQDDTRDLATGATLWWMPTTHEFGPNGSFGDWDWHDDLATRFGVSGAWSREDRMAEPGLPSKNTQMRLADARLVWDTGALAPGVTVQTANYQLYSADAGFKYRGIFLQGHYYWRRIDRFVADGPVPVAEIVDDGFYVQAAFYPIKQTLELYGVTSWVFGDDTAGFDTSHEYIGGVNYYPFDSRNYRINLQLIDITRSPVSSLFGYYVGGQTGTTVALATSVYF
jgi:hypothetical protein